MKSAAQDRWRFVLDEAGARELEAARVASDERTRLALDKMKRVENIFSCREKHAHLDMTLEVDGLLFCVRETAKRDDGWFYCLSCGRRFPSPSHASAAAAEDRSAAQNKDTSGIRAAAIPTETPRTAASGGGDTAATRHLMQAEKDMEAVVLTGDGDPEVAHGEADAILCRALKLLGYRRLIDLYEQVPKWYA